MRGGGPLSATLKFAPSKSVYVQVFKIKSNQNMCIFKRRIKYPIVSDRPKACARRMFFFSRDAESTIDQTERFPPTAKNVRTAQRGKQSTRGSRKALARKTVSKGSSSPKLSFHDPVGERPQKQSRNILT